MLGSLMQMPMDPMFAALVGVIGGMVAGVTLTILLLNADA